MIGTARPLQRAAEPLPGSIPLYLLTKILALMLPIASCATKRPQNSVGGRQLTTQATAPPQVAMESTGMAPLDIERIRQVIVVRFIHPLQAIRRQKGTESKHIVSQMVTDFNASKQFLWRRPMQPILGRQDLQCGFVIMRWSSTHV